ncbi:MAG: response regulator [Elusimicrobia bacterium]|nr:response regulator [Elusimicrobiota bacterium]
MKKIVVIDDDASMRHVLSAILEDEGYAVSTADDGPSGINLVRREKPDMVLLDLLMPGMHGFEVFQRLKELESLRSTKILIVSSKSYPRDIKTAQELGVDGYLIKPFELHDLKEKVRHLIEGGGAPAQLRFWGTRGSIPAPGSQTQRYGGNTACTELKIGSRTIIIDAGTGLRELGQRLIKESAGQPVQADLFIGHTHWDHIQGFPFFTPLYDSRNRLMLYGSRGTDRSFKEVMSGQMTDPYFPVALSEVAAALSFAELSQPVELDGIKVTTHYLNHPGITIGFRFQSRNWSVAYISDHEPYAKLQGSKFSEEDEKIAQFVQGADLLISEAQYTDEEYRIKKRWGHSTFSDVVTLAERAQVKKLALFHHDPTHTDEMMDRFVDHCREHVVKNRIKVECFAAQEGMSLKL